MRYARAILLASIFLAIGLAKSGSALGQDSNIPIPAPDIDKALGPGDVVSYEVIEDGALPLHLRVSDAGFLQIPIIGNVAASGKTCAEVATQIKKQLEGPGKYYFTATVKLALEQVGPLKPHPTSKVSVTGKVTHVGLVEIPYGETLSISEAITKAGGPTDFGDLRKVTLTRKNADGSKQTIHIDIKKATGTKDDMELQDGDSIDVGAKIINWGG